jgi:hypothetical protein
VIDIIGRAAMQIVEVDAIGHSPPASAKKE